MKVAIVHDWLVGGGAEKVVLELHRMFPDAPIYSSYCTDEWRTKLDHKVITGFLQRWPFPSLRKYIPVLRIWWFTHLDLSGYDLVISSSGAEAKGIHVSSGTTHINYCHAPTHYYWSRYEEYMNHPGFGVFDPLARLGLRILVGPLRRWDYKAAQRPDIMIANSTHIHDEIKQYYNRDSTVIFPPVDVDRFKKAHAAPKRHGFLISGRHTPYKRFDLAIAACTQLGLDLTVIGEGPDTERLRRLAGPTITFLGRVNDAILAEQFRKAEALLFPGVDDFGITAIEAMAAGTPVIAYRGGGALDYVIPGKTGEFFNEQTVESLVSALSSFTLTHFVVAEIQKSSTVFRPENFSEKFLKIIENVGRS